jgi:hypothetical protein
MEVCPQGLHFRQVASDALTGILEYGSYGGRNRTRRSCPGYCAFHGPHVYDAICRLGSSTERCLRDRRRAPGKFHRNSLARKRLVSSNTKLDKDTLRLHNDSRLRESQIF